MSEMKDLDPSPAISRLLNVSRAGKLSWEPTADRQAFVTSLAGEQTIKIQLVNKPTIDDWGNPDTYQTPRLDLLDDKGKVLWALDDASADRKLLWQLYEVARRIGNRLDERLEKIVQALDKLGS